MREVTMYNDKGCMMTDEERWRAGTIAWRNGMPKEEVCKTFRMGVTTLTKWDGIISRELGLCDNTTGIKSKIAAAEFNLRMAEKEVRKWKIVELLTNGVPCKEVADKLSVSLNYVYDIRKSFHIPEEKKPHIKMRDDGKDLMCWIEAISGRKSIEEFAGKCGIKTESMIAFLKTLVPRTEKVDS